MARELAPAGAQSGPKRWGLLSSPAGASSLATEIYCAGLIVSAACSANSCSINAALRPSLPV
ncbi:hypothetical protein EXW72_22850 [Pseudomonas sp. BCA14]|nr:hypothetical protein EXW70_24920 [Pseudomonas sp. JMN1]TFF05430.1 hypothetical protein EXW71_25610 [Pseudomonas sp. BCA17]TFF19307.1 hypothetical protein EXW73_25550 [Pseudomonas sp. BCA13]TFF21096.1 hypothetical protein EXW72_22850 [Pseudomonas sp. BCA14]